MLCSYQYIYLVIVLFSLYPAHIISSDPSSDDHIQWSSDGKFIACTWQQHSNRVTQVTWSPNEHYIISKDPQKTIHVHDNEGNYITKWQHPNSIYYLNVSPETKPIISLDTKENGKINSLS